MTTNTKCPNCGQTFASVAAMQQHFNATHRRGAVAEAVDGDTGPDSMVERGAIPRDRCGNCRFMGRANNIYVCRWGPGTPGMTQGAAGLVPVTFYPPVFKHDWCGKFERGEWPAELAGETPPPGISKGN